jgi:hypothetical protein
MIVRIPLEGQFELDDTEAEELNAQDNKLVEIVAKGDAKQFAANLAKMLDYVRERGDLLPDTELHASTIVLPPGDLELEEAQTMFKGEGLIPG